MSIIYICRCCKRPAVIDLLGHPKEEVICTTRGCPHFNLITPIADEEAMYHRFMQQSGKLLVMSAIAPASEFKPRVSEANPTFVPLRTGDPVPGHLMAALNATAFVRELRQIVIKKLNDNS